MTGELIARALPLACALFLVRFIAAEGIYQRAVRTRCGLQFPVGIGLRLTLRVGGPFLLFVSYKMTQQVNSTFDWVSAFLVALMGMACIVAEPGQITVSPSGLSQTSMLGLLKRTITWDGASARSPNGLRQVLVIGSDGRTITHSQYHVGQGEFIAQLKRHGVYVQT